jgi:hypothetical protein
MMPEIIRNSPERNDIENFQENLKKLKPKANPKLKQLNI